MIELLTGITSVFWEYIIVYLLLGAGVYFTIRSRFVQFRYFFHAWKIMLCSRQQSKCSISSFQALCTSLATHIGTGNLAGVAIALCIGGPGAIFWMWIVALLGMATSFLENTLAQLYKTNNYDGTFRGGPAYYIKKALGLRWLGIIFSLLMISSFGFICNAVHSNTVAQALTINNSLTPEIVGIILGLLTALIIFKGLRTIVHFSQWVVPFMAISYLIISLIVVGMHLDQLPGVFALIIEGAFGLQSATGGVIGYSISQAIMQGIKRGLFSNEAGMGSGPNVAATATPYPHHPAAQGIVSMTSVFIDTIVVCTASAAIILVSGYLEAGPNLNGIQLLQASLAESVGPWGEWFLAVTVFFFGFTSIVANYYCGETNLRFIRNNRRLLFFYRASSVILVYVGAVSSLETVWALADLAIGMLALINLGVVVLLSEPTIQVLKDYDRQIKMGRIPVFIRHRHPFLNKTMDNNVWVHPAPQDDFDINDNTPTLGNFREAESS